MSKFLCISVLLRIYKVGAFIFLCIDMAGNYSKRLEPPRNCTFGGFINPWNFYCLSLQPWEKYIVGCEIMDWLPTVSFVSNANVAVPLGKCKNSVDGQTWRCNKNKLQVLHSAKFILFKIQDNLAFIKNFLYSQTLYKFKQFSGVDYKWTSIDWAKFIRDLFRQWVWDTLKDLKF